jgi:hypothetical protein
MEIGYYVDALFHEHGKPKWVPYGIPGEPPQCWGARLDALNHAKRFAAKYNKRCRVRGGEVVHGFVEPDGTVRNATEEERYPS